MFDSLLGVSKLSSLAGCTTAIIIVTSLVKKMIIRYSYMNQYDIYGVQ